MLGPAMLALAACVASGATPSWMPAASGGFAAVCGQMLVAQAGTITRSLDLTFPWGRPSRWGDFAQWATLVPRPAGETVLRFYLRDDFTGATAGYHFIQLRADNETIWEQDVAGGSLAARLVEIPLPKSRSSRRGPLRLTFRLCDRKAVQDFGVRVQIAGVELVGEQTRKQLFPLEVLNTSYTAFPPDIPLPSLPPVLGWTMTANIVQPWGVTQDVAIRQAACWAPRFRDEFGFNAIIVLPPEAHNAIQVDFDNWTQERLLAEEQFRDAVARYRAAGLKLILYTGIMHSGHDALWQTGRLAQEHPEWLVRDPDGAVVTAFGQPWLCPSTGALQYTLDYTVEIARRYEADGVMLDNNQFLHSDAGKATCYCDSCKAGFAAYVRERFGDDGVRSYFACEPHAVAIPLTDEGPLWGLWLAWRKRVWAEALELYRTKLRTYKPDMVVLANTQYEFDTYILAADRQFEHEDAVLSESRGLAPSTMAAKMVLGRALSRGRPLWNYIGTFEERDFTLMRPPDDVEGLVAASLAVGANPWIVFYGFEGEHNQPSVGALARYMGFWSEHRDLLTMGADRGDVAVIMSPESRDLAGEPMPPPWLASLLGKGYAVRGLWEPTGLPEPSLARVRVVVATSAACMRAATARNLAAWVLAGGTLVAQPDTGWRDEYGRLRDRSALSEALRANASAPGKHELGRGAVVCVDDTAHIEPAIAAATRPLYHASPSATVYWRAVGGRQVISIATHQPGPCEVSLWLPERARDAELLQPGQTPQRLTVAAPGEATSLTISQRLGLVVFETGE